jgi:hypothetical protein
MVKSKPAFPVRHADDSVSEGMDQRTLVAAVVLSGLVGDRAALPGLDWCVDVAVQAADKLLERLER